MEEALDLSFDRLLMMMMMMMSPQDGGVSPERLAINNTLYCSVRYTVYVCFYKLEKHLKELISGCFGVS